ncbi:hypothetical protein L207DRAFT_586565 [Hyaloscypha variabilis F]|uniref:RNase III domain-containing protein n=1 Tax=Hyaloscypha variabilis (strain UAMH 11265 / GT02V1 / F) TaxID=1149755 RepID=A0A2J6REE4_HYAVF|nr:hypothetical protein L207DRAFT_586565 [Hyaloscypha variabilis F]
MASSAYFQWLEAVIGYRFEESSLLEKALTAPGAEGDKGTAEDRARYQGNRLLARLGKRLLLYLDVKRAFWEGTLGQGSTTNAWKSEANGNNYIARAVALKMDRNMKLNPRQRGIAEPRTFKEAFYALVGAVWQDSGDDFTLMKAATY